ncbi:unnamed protein product [Arctogadus glacialis]
MERKDLLSSSDLLRLEDLLKSKRCQSLLTDIGKFADSQDASCCFASSPAWHILAVLPNSTLEVFLEMERKDLLSSSDLLRLEDLLKSKRCQSLLTDIGKFADSQDCTVKVLAVLESELGAFLVLKWRPQPRHVTGCTMCGVSDASCFFASSPAWHILAVLPNLTSLAHSRCITQQMEFQVKLLKVDQVLNRDDTKAEAFLCKDILKYDIRLVESPSDLFHRLGDQNDSENLLTDLLLTVDRSKLLSDSDRNSEIKNLISPYRTEMEFQEKLLKSKLEVFLEMERKDLLSSSDLLRLEDLLKSKRCQSLLTDIGKFADSHASPRDRLLHVWCLGRLIMPCQLTSLAHSRCITQQMEFQVKLLKVAQDLSRHDTKAEAFLCKDILEYDMRLVESPSDLFHRLGDQNDSENLLTDLLLTVDCSKLLSDSDRNSEIKNLISPYR